MNIKQLRQQKAEALAKAKALHALAGTEGRELTKAEGEQYDTLMASVESLNANIARTEKLMEIERAEPSAAIEVSVPEAGKKPWANFGEQLQAVARAKQAIDNGRHAAIDPRLFASLGANESVPAEGGFLVQPDFAGGLLKRTYDLGEVSSRCNRMPMSSSRMVLNAVDEDSRVNGSRWGGIQAFWLAEGQTYNGTKPKFREVQLVANKLIGLCYATEEQLEDGPALQSYIEQAFPDEFSFMTDDAIVNGLGAGQPLGIQIAPATIIVAKDAGQATGTLSASNILNMKSRLWAPSFKNAVWLIEQSVEPVLYPLLLAGTNATTAALMYTPPGMYGNNSDYGLLMGRPVIIIEQAADLSSQGDITLVDLQQYLLAQRSDLRADTSIHVAFLTGEQAFRFMLRMDGQPWWKKPLTPKAPGAPTRSPYVTLAAR
jgi:HK97 family phage major capsid protein